MPGIRNFSHHYRHPLDVLLLGLSFLYGRIIELLYHVGQKCFHKVFSFCYIDVTYILYSVVVFADAPEQRRGELYSHGNYSVNIELLHKLYYFVFPLTN